MIAAPEPACYCHWCHGRAGVHGWEAREVYRAQVENARLEREIAPMYVGIIPQGDGLYVVLVERAAKSLHPRRPEVRPLTHRTVTAPMPRDQAAAWLRQVYAGWGIWVRPCELTPLR